MKPYTDFALLSEGWIPSAMPRTSNRVALLAKYISTSASIAAAVAAWKKGVPHKCGWSGLMVNSIITSLSDTIITPERQAQQLTPMFAARQNRIDAHMLHWLA